MLSRACESIKHRNASYHEENQYLNLLEDILSTNSEFVGRNGKTLCVYGSAMRFSLEHNKLPLITTKKVAWKLVYVNYCGLLKDLQIIKC